MRVVVVDNQATFLLTKAETQVFSALCSDRKAPHDSRAVRFTCYRGRYYVWATDGVQFVCVELNVGHQPASDLTCTVTGPSLKSSAAKLKKGEDFAMRTAVALHPLAVNTASGVHSRLPALHSISGLEYDETVLDELLTYATRRVLNVGSVASWVHLSVRQIETIAQVCQAVP